MVSCSPKHKNCSVWHRNLVFAYRDERARQLSAIESITGGYEGDMQLYLAQDGKPIVTFKDFLIAFRR